MPKKHAKRKSSSFHISAAKRQSLKKKKARKNCRSSTSNRKQRKFRSTSKDQEILKKICNENPSRDLSRFYQVQPRWTASKRCANWLKCLPKRSYWSNGTTQSTKSNNSYDELQTLDNRSTRLTETDEASPLTQPYSSTASYQDKKHRSYLTNDSNTSNLQKHPSDVRKSFENHGASSHTKTSPYASAKQRSESVRDSCLQNHQISNELYMRNFAKSKKSFDSLEQLRKTRFEKYKQKFKDLERQKQISKSRENVPLLQKIRTPNPTSKISIWKSNFYAPTKEASSLGWVILKIVYRLEGHKSFPFNIFHMLRRKGFTMLSLSDVLAHTNPCIPTSQQNFECFSFRTLNQALGWMQKKELLTSSVDDRKHFPRYILTPRGRSILEKRMKEIIETRRRQMRNGGYTGRPSYKSMKKLFRHR